MGIKFYFSPSDLLFHFCSSIMRERVCCQLISYLSVRNAVLCLTLIQKMLLQILSSLYNTFKYMFARILMFSSYTDLPDRLCDPEGCKLASAWKLDSGTFSGRRNVPAVAVLRYNRHRVHHTLRHHPQNRPAVLHA